MAVATRQETHVPSNIDVDALWTPRWYYVMRNVSSGKLYFGQTIRDLNKYKGSGVYWKNHCKSHGGFTKANVVLVQSWWICDEELASLFLDEFASKVGQYWSSDNLQWANSVEEDTLSNPFYKNASHLARQRNKTTLANGTHNFLKQNRNYKSTCNEFTSSKAIESNYKRIYANTHHFLKENETDNMKVHRSQRMLQMNQYLLDAGLHSSQNESSKKKIGQKNAVHNKNRVLAGEHQFIGSIYAVNTHGVVIKISKEQYASQIGPKSEWEFVHPTSAEGKRRRGKA